MAALDKLYSSDWKDIGSMLVYQDKGFQFHSDVYIVELEGCLIKCISNMKVYQSDAIEIACEELIDRFKAAADISIIIMSNHISNMGVNLDIIKQKTERLMQRVKIPFLCIYALKPNCFMKPHTGMWKFLNAFYRTYGQKNIHTTTLISDEGGICAENGEYTSDVDRAFAENIGAKYRSINEYLYGCKEEYKWDPRIIGPEIRQKYVEEINKYENPNILEKLLEFGEQELYVVFITGAPRCGKTKLAKQITRDWQKNKQLGVTHAVEILDHREYTECKRRKLFKKALDDRISVILDGGCYTTKLRKPYIEYLEEKNIPALFVEVNCGFRMAEVLNHAYVERSGSESATLYPTRDYCVYRSQFTKPPDSQLLRYVLYMPRIDQHDAVMKFRY